ncbi:ribonuclease H-like domain-containing protein [Tanacetum coccineum]|uniref:Ribonuclease H-like domain-containing protein n=1 Tax=Tanacetum coccineum TaxID=301880 RepID=A0ABQ5G3U3_9ASTR
MSVHGYTDDEYEPDDQVTLMSRLDMKGKNKTSFTDGSCKRSNTNEVLGRQRDKVNVVVLGWTLNSISEEFFLGLDDSYMQIRSNVLSRELLPDVRNMLSSLVVLVPPKARLIIDPGANQHLTYTDKFLVNFIDISKLKIKVSHHNGTEAIITKVARDIKFVIAFDESHCYFLPQDFREMKVLGIENWHCRLGHPSDQVMIALKNDITDVVSAPSDTNQDFTHVNFFNDFLSEDPDVPSDDNISYASSQSEGSNPSHPDSPTFDHFEDDLGHYHGSNGSTDEGEMVATSIEHLCSSEGIAHNIPSPNVAKQVFQPLRRYNRVTVLPKKYNDYVMPFKVKFGHEKFVIYKNLSSETFYFVTELNKNVEPKTFWEASEDQHWVEAMNNEMNALYNNNNTWEITELPKGRNAIGSKWDFKIKFKFMVKLKDIKQD